MTKQRFDELQGGAELRRVLTNAGWSVLRTYAVRHRYGCIERVTADGDWEVRYPDGNRQRGKDQSAVLASMHTANLTFYREFESPDGSAARAALLAIRTAADQALADARAADEGRDRMTLARLAFEEAQAAAARADREGAVAAVAVWKRRVANVMHLSGWPMP